MYIILNKSNYVCTISPEIIYAKTLRNGMIACTEPSEATLLYAPSNDTFYSIRDCFRAVEMEHVPQDAEAGTWFYRAGTLVLDPEAVAEKKRGITQKPEQLRADIDYMMLMGGF